MKAQKHLRYAMPEPIQQALPKRDLMETYHSRLCYRQNDCIGWIIRNNSAETQEKRLVRLE